MGSNGQFRPSDFGRVANEDGKPTSIDIGQTLRGRRIFGYEVPRETALGQSMRPDDPGYWDTLAELLRCADDLCAAAAYLRDEHAAAVAAGIA